MAKSEDIKCQVDNMIPLLDHKPSTTFSYILLLLSTTLRKQSCVSKSFSISGPHHAILDMVLFSSIMTPNNSDFVDPNAAEISIKSVTPERLHGTRRIVKLEERKWRWIPRSNLRREEIDLLNTTETLCERLFWLCREYRRSSQREKSVSMPIE